MNQPGAPNPYYHKPSGGISRQNVKDLIKKLVPKFAPVSCVPWPAPDAKRSGALGTEPDYGEYELVEGSGTTTITIPIFNLDEAATFEVIGIVGTEPTISNVVITPGSPSSVDIDVDVTGMTAPGDTAYIAFTNETGCKGAIQIVILPPA